MDKKQLSVKECNDIALKVLIDVAEFCDKNNITYFLACGTLLGAIKYKGYIPWDDDIDIMMPRPDYEKFVNTYKSDKCEVLKPSEGLFYYAKAYDKNTVKYEVVNDYSKYKPFGIDIDIFPLDGIVNDEKIINKLYKRTCFLEMLLRLSNQPIFYRKNPIKAINRIIPRIIGSKNLVKLIEANAKTYDYDTSEYVIRMRRSTNGFTGALEKQVYEKDYAMFEGHKFCIPKGYDKWLTTFYGDYMNSLPPIEDRKPSHICECYRVENE